MGSVARALLILGLAGCGDGGPASPWSAEVRIGHDQGPSPASDFFPELAVDAAGNAILVFNVDGAIWARRFDVGANRWLALARLGDGAGALGRPQLAVDAAGNAIAAWGGLGLRARRFDASRGWPDGWGPVESIAPAIPDVDLRLDELDVTADGHAAVAFERPAAVTSAEEVWVAVREAGADWRPPVQLSPVGPRAHDATIGLAHVGASLELITTWIETDADGRTDVMRSVAYHRLDTHQLEPVELDSFAVAGSGEYDSARVGVDDDGGAVAVVVQQTGSGSRLLAYRYADGAWTAPVMFDAVGSATLIQYDLAIDGRGHAIVAWAHCDPTPCMVSARASINSAWRPAVPLGSAQFLRPAVALAPSGRAVVLWVAPGALHQANEVIATELDPATGWSEPHGLGATNPGYLVTAAMGAGDTAVAAWVTLDGGDNVVKGSVYRP